MRLEYPILSIDIKNYMLALKLTYQSRKLIVIGTCNHNLK